MHDPATIRHEHDRPVGHTADAAGWPEARARRLAVLLASGATQGWRSTIARHLAARGLDVAGCSVSPRDVYEYWPRQPGLRKRNGEPFVGRRYQAGIDPRIIDALTDLECNAEAEIAAGRRYIWTPERVTALGEWLAKRLEDERTMERMQRTVTAGRPWRRPHWRAITWHRALMRAFTEIAHPTSGFRIRAYVSGQRGLTPGFVSAVERVAQRIGHRPD